MAHHPGPMNPAAQTLALLETAFAGRPAPRVHRLHLPPLPWNGNKDGEFGAIELESGALGLSYLLLGDALASLAGSGAALQGADALALARRWADPQAGAAEAALGFAAVNALSREVFDRAGYEPPPAADSIGGLDPARGEAVGMVGFFPPLARQLVERGAALTVLELRADLAGAHEGFQVTLDREALAPCTQVLSTSTVLLNGTLPAVRAACRGARRFVLLGPGAGCLPDALFAMGVSALGGSWVQDREGFADALAGGAKWGGFARKFMLEVEGYPGLPALLARAG